MSKRHQASRRRTYGRRQHEVHERSDRVGRWEVDARELLEETFATVDEPVFELGHGAGLRAGWMGVS